MINNIKLEVKLLATKTVLPCPIVERFTVAQSGSWKGRQTASRVDSQTGRWMDGRTGGQMDGRTDGWAGGWTGEEVDGGSDSRMASFMKATVGINREQSGADGDSWVTFGNRIEILPKKAAK